MTERRSLSVREILRAAPLMLGAVVLTVAAIITIFALIDRHWAFGAVPLVFFGYGAFLGVQDLRGGTLTTVQALNVSGMLIVLSIFLFATFSYMLEASGVASYRGSGTPGEADRLFVLAGYYGWHFLDMLPVVDATKTLGITEPLAVAGIGPRIPVLLFKALVGFVLLRAIAGWWKGRSAAEQA